jgi:hypothetical protein
MGINSILLKYLGYSTCFWCIKVIKKSKKTENCKLKSLSMRLHVWVLSCLSGPARIQLCTCCRHSWISLLRLWQLDTG